MTVFTLEDITIVSQPTIVCNLSCNSIRSLTLSTELVPLYSQDFLHICYTKDRYVNIGSSHKFVPTFVYTFHVSIYKHTAIRDQCT